MVARKEHAARRDPARKEDSSRDRRFVAEHRGGPLARAQHLQLMEWACACARHILPLCAAPVDKRLPDALAVAARWREGTAAVGEARKSSVACIAAAKAAVDPVAAAAARSVGHAAATAHMADHSLGAAWYALKAAKGAGKSSEEERRWQDGQLPAEIRDLVLSARSLKGI